MFAACSAETVSSAKAASAAEVRAERKKSGDPRLSVAERYASREDYLNRYAEAVDELVKERWILPEDRAALLKRGEEEWAVEMNDGVRSPAAR